ncbi:MAG: hypothetical protein QG623_547 [Patescibacteria group bacterium]|jgi:hypothetical protein|nr:hypothetical protein [Patescibacteria group bacterium]
MANANSRYTARVSIPIELVDSLSLELASEYDNPQFRAWYCGVIQEFGVERVHEWRRRSAEGNNPARLFSHYIKSARKARQS